MVQVLLKGIWLFALNFFREGWERWRYCQRFWERNQDIFVSSPSSLAVTGQGTEAVILRDVAEKFWEPFWGQFIGSLCQWTSSLCWELAESLFCISSFLMLQRVDYSLLVWYKHVDSFTNMKGKKWILFG